MSAISGHTTVAEQAVEFAREAKQCAVCLLEYTEEERNDPEKVIELFCDHNFHSACINQWILNATKDPNCPICKRNFRQLDSLPFDIDESSPLAAFANEEIFYAILQHRQQNNAHDEGALRGLNKVEQMKEELFQIQQQMTANPAGRFDQILRSGGRDLKQHFIFQAGLLVVDRKDLGVELQQDIMREIEYILRIGEVRTDLRAPVRTDLRTAAEEAERWRDVPFQDWPEQMRTTEEEMRAKSKEEQTQGYGVVIKGEHSPMRVSGRHIQRWLTHPKVVKEVQIENFVIGPSELSKYIGVVTNVPSFPEQFKAFLNDPCCFYPGRPARETHLVYLYPEIMEIAGEVIRLYLGNAAAMMQRLAAQREQSSSDMEETPLRSVKILKSRWVAITKGPIPYSQYRSYKDQKEMIHELGKGLYECASALDILIGAYLDFHKTGKIFGENRNDSFSPTGSLSVCEQSLSADSPQDVIPGRVRGFIMPGSGALKLRVDFSKDNWSRGCCGMAAVRKISEEPS